MDDDVLRPDRRETIAAMFTDTLRETRAERRELQVGPILIDQSREIGDAQETIAQMQLDIGSPVGGTHGPTLIHSSHVRRP